MDKAAAQLSDAKVRLAEAQRVLGEASEMGASLRDERLRNHFAPRIEAAWRGQG